MICALDLHLSGAAMSSVYLYTIYARTQLPRFTHDASGKGFNIEWINHLHIMSTICSYEVYSILDSYEFLFPI
jgi:hypothetical protein